jgi:hypothetical protein
MSNIIAMNSGNRMPSDVTKPRPNRTVRRPIASCCGLVLMLVVVASGLGITGCATDPTQGYTAMSLHRQDVATIAVPIFTNETFHRDVEFLLADALVKEIERRTPYKVAPSTRADTILSGRVTEVVLDSISRSRQTGLTEEMILRVTIDFQWKDQRNNANLLERRSFSGTALFVPSAPSGEPLEIGQFAVVQQLARDIVDEMQADW